MTHEVEHQLTYIHALDAIAKQNAMDVAQLAGALRDSIQNFSLQLNRVEADLLDTHTALEKQARYSAAIQDTEMAIFELKFSITQLQGSLDITSLGQMSSVLINPYNLSVILQHVSLQLPAGLSLLTGLTVEEMYVYYTIVTVHTIATSKNIRLFVDIPLKAADRYFELYEVHSLPFFHEGVGKFMSDDMFIYLAVAENKQFFAQMIPYMLLNVNREPNCLIALFFGKADVMRSKFKRLILDGTFEPVWIRWPDATSSIYNLSTPQWVTVQRQKTGSPPTAKMNYRMQLERTGVLSNLSSCYIYAENFKLLPHSLGKSTVALTETHIIPPNVEKILHNSEENVLQFTANQPMDLQRLDDILIRAISRSHAEAPR